MHGRTIRRVLLATMLTAGLGVAAGGQAFASTSARHAATASDKKKAKKPTVKLATSTLGKILVDAKGRTLYAFDPDGSNIDASQCTGGCASVWPPLTAKKAQVGKGLDASFITVNASGQVAYNNHLLYRYSGDSAKGDTFGQGIGGVWHVVGADGSPITA